MGIKAQKAPRFYKDFTEAKWDLLMYKKNGQYYGDWDEYIV